ncbi:MAG: AAA family ATPase [Archangiaceae bacterium]|nr:AAA family ATPase [Archangiaceae bacterium]
MTTLSRTKSTDWLAPTTTSRGDSAEPSSRATVKPARRRADVFIDEGALSFDRGGKPAPRETQLQWAERFLQTLRVQTQGKLTFGGALGGSLVDNLESLSRYYPVLKIAAMLSRDPVLSGGVTAFLPQVSMPRDLEALLEPAAGAPGRWGATEPAGPLGEAMWNEGTKDAVWQRLDAAATPSLEELKLSDDAVAFFVQHFGKKIESGWLHFDNALQQQALLRIFARAVENGAAIAGLTAETLNEVDWTQTPETAAVLRRLVTAAGIDPRQVHFGGTHLASELGSGRGQVALGRSPRWVPPTEALPSAPLGTHSYTRAELDALTEAHDPALFELSDAGLEMLCMAWREEVYRLAVNSTGHEDPAWHTALMNAWDRAIVIKADTGPGYVEGYLGRLAAPVLDDPGAMLAAARLMRRAGLSATTVAFDGKPLETNDAFNAAAQRLDRLAAGALGPLPEKRAATVLDARPLALHLPPDIKRRFDNRLESYFSMPDAAIIERFAGKALDPGRYDSFGSPMALSFVARAIELEASVSTRLATQNWLRGPLSGPYATAPYVGHLARLANACGVPFDRVRLTLEDGSHTTLAAHPDLPPPSPESLAAAATLTAQLDLLDPAGASSLDARIGAIETLVAEASHVELQELFAGALQRLRDGKLEPVDLGSASAAERTRLIAAVTRDAHLGVSAALAGLLLKGGEDALEAQLLGQGYSNEQAGEWARHAQSLQALAPERRAVALADLVEKPQPDFLMLPARIALAEQPALDAGSLRAIFDRFVAVDATALVRAMVDCAALSPEKGSERAAVSSFIKARILDGTLQAGDARAGIDLRRCAVLMPFVEAELDAALTAVATADVLTLPGASKALGDAIKAQHGFVEPEGLVIDALNRLYQKDLATVLPLGQADTELGGVEPKLWWEEEEGGAVVTVTPPSVTVGGVPLRLDIEPGRDLRAVPRAAEADLVMTATTERNLRLIAAEWRRARPVLLEGPTSAGKTSAVRYLAYKTGTPYRRINLSQFTDVSDLLGRYVGGEKRFTEADLKKKTDAEVAGLSQEYGLGDGLTRDEQIDQLLEAQLQPRWVDGAVVQAMRKGEVLLLDEINLARPEVIERLNSLFDDDGNLVLTEHRNEIVEPHRNFRIFGTMNPSSYAGRARLSEAMRSRWTNLYCQGLTQADVTTILKARFGATVPEAQLARLIAAQDVLARQADEGAIGRATGGIAFSLRNAFRVCERFERYQGGELSDEALMRRETEEIYRGGLIDPDDLQTVTDVLDTAMPWSGPGFYDALEVEETADTFSIGDVTLRKLNTGHPLVPPESSQLVLTARTRQVLYRIAKALDCGENVALIGERASGKTAVAKMLAGLIGQPYYRQLISGSTDVMQLVGGFDDRGWKDGLLLDAGRPDGVPGMLLLDELNLGSSALLERLNPVLDDERKLVLAERDGEEVRLHNDFHFVAAMNPPTKGYGGRNKLSKAMQNRLTQIYVPELSERSEQLEIVAAIAAKKGVPAAVAEALVDLQAWAVAGYRDGTLGAQLREGDRPVLSIRQLLAALDMVAEFQTERGVGDAFLLAVEAYYASSSEPDDCSAILAHARELAS